VKFLSEVIVKIDVSQLILKTLILIGF
jgi:hypothetical protein